MNQTIDVPRGQAAAIKDRGAYSKLYMATAAFYRNLFLLIGIR